MYSSKLSEACFDKKRSKMHMLSLQPLSLSLSLSAVQVFLKFLKHQLRSPGSSVGSALAY